MARHGLRAIRLRPFNHIGPGQSDRFALASFVAQIVNIESGRQEPVLSVGNLDAKRDFLDVRDVASAYLKAMVAANLDEAAVLDIASGDARRIGDILESAAQTREGRHQGRARSGAPARGRHSDRCGRFRARSRLPRLGTENPLRADFGRHAPGAARKISLLTLIELPDSDLYRGYSRRPDGRARLWPLAAPSGRPRRSGSGFGYARGDSMGTIVAASARRRSPGKRRWPSSHEFLEEPDNSLFDFMRPWPLSKAMVSRRMRSQLRFAEGNGRPSVTSPAGTHAAIDAASGEAALAAFEASHGADRPPVTGPRRMLVDGWPLG